MFVSHVSLNHQMQVLRASLLSEVHPLSDSQRCPDSLQSWISIWHMFPTSRPLDFLCRIPFVMPWSWGSGILTAGAVPHSSVPLPPPCMFVVTWTAATKAHAPEYTSHRLTHQTLGMGGNHYKRWPRDVGTVRIQLGFLFTPISDKIGWFLPYYAAHSSQD